MIKETKEIINSMSGKKKIIQKGMPILFVCPPFSLTESLEGLVSKAPPLGLAYIAATLEKNGYNNIRIIDMKAEKMDFEKLKKEILNLKPVIIGLGLTTRQVSSGAKIIKMAKGINPGTICVVGGPHISVLPERTLTEINADICVCGEGEITMLEIANAIYEKNGFDSIDGIVFRKGGAIKKNSPRPLVEDIDSLPFPARHLLLPPVEYSKGSQTILSPIETIIMTSRGCPFRCAFCDKSVFGKTFRVRSIKNVIDEIELLIEKYQIKSIRFFDDLLTVIPKRIKELCHELKRRDIKLIWSCESRVNSVTPEMLVMMKGAGCVEIHFGIESGNQGILDLQQKDITLEQVRNAVKWANKAGLDTRGYFILGFPGDTKETIKETIKFGKSLNLTSAGVYLYVPYPGVYERKYKLEDYGQVLAKNWDDYVVFERPAYLPNGMAEEELIKLYKRAYLEMHLNFKSIFNLLKRLKNITALKYYITEFFWSIGLKK